MIKVDLSHAKLNEDIASYKDKVAEIHEMIHNKTGAGNDFLGWVDLPTQYDREEVARIKAKAKSLSEEIDVLLVCGIGGSYLGARAAIEAINGLYPTQKVEILYIGNTFSSTYLAQIKEYVKDKEFGINVISKSGTTTETSVAFRIFKEMLEQTKGKEVASRRIVATTDAHKGALKTLADKEGYEEFVVPDDIGGRFSVLTAVGLFPIAMAGIDVDEMMKGAKDAQDKYNNADLMTNDAYKYGVARQMLNKQGYPAEMFVTYELQLSNVAEWWKQLFGESEGKEGKGVLPHSAVFSTDLHSLGQFIQEGSKVLFETVFKVEKPQLDLEVPSDEDNLDNLNYLAGKTVDYVNKKACEGTIDAHVNVGGVPNIEITIDEMNAYSFGYMVYFFEKACALSVYLLGVNPFNQPGVEVYKKNMFKLLGKPGY
ncbi:MULTISPECIES: glucose-6-phosphate isomerase [Kandleria]|jgi:glucose-6-phosphate isomerase|uniref:Glucose-6-phosphate isomerase n=1 Tax=Kandleria vitulina DSM 20405 TaxID=1410657 RepID=A0A0R2HGU1_9FIRM|nr:MULTISPECIES: glucose-6-phosphate isomerase [Kandleria]KRN48509.1 glucose-6-phosphate isomerase [Kandleria vitulina DSM 20405]MBP3276717.1 glucose-6-phosphate isomerase [Kandleria sp.]MEE0989657.1 glucose-6-phosphate isomerase [Kandleria vitulina]SDM14237.1 glucose-6-phosphate isomerase [Kandleria vitulina]SEJ26779.1 glucose-6-phosphate isomerase [Kandleria vitulina]